MTGAMPKNLTALILRDGLYRLPRLPKKLAAKLADRANWPPEMAEEYREVHQQFAAARGELERLIMGDRDSRMTSAAKLILLYLVRSVNCDSGQCDPAHKTISDALHIGLRQVQRIVPLIAESGWISARRRGRTSSNAYEFVIAATKLDAIAEHLESLRQDRKAARNRRRRDPGEPTPRSDYEPTPESAREPTPRSDKLMKENRENELLNTRRGREGDGFAVRTREGPPDPNDAPFPIPASEREVQAMVVKLAGDDDDRNLTAVLRYWLMRGRLTPSFAKTILEPGREDREARRTSALRGDRKRRA